MRPFLFLLTVPLACAAAPQELLRSTTESELDNGIMPPREIVKLILRDEPAEVEALHECLADKGLEKKAIAKMFIASAIDLNNDGLPDYFIRPALVPYCHAFYGAHSFRFWYVTSHRKQSKITYKIKHTSGGDQTSVLASMSKGHNDLEVIAYTANGAYRTTWRFNGRAYKKASCVVQTMGNSGWAGDTPC